MADVPYPQYPVQTGPSFSSVAQRHRMEIEDALVAEQEQKERQQRTVTQGGKAFVGYNEMLRGFMEAKYAKPELKFWEYAQNPSVGAAYRLEGKRKILEAVEGGVDPKDIRGMSFGERHKEGLRGIFGQDTVPDEAPYAQDPTALTAAQEELESLRTPQPSRGSLAAAQKEIDVIKPQVQAVDIRDAKSLADAERLAMGKASVDPDFPKQAEPMTDIFSEPVVEDFFTKSDEAGKAAESTIELTEALQEVHKGTGSMPVWGRIWGEGKDPNVAMAEQRKLDTAVLEKKFVKEDAAKLAKKMSRAISVDMDGKILELGEGTYNYQKFQNAKDLGAISKISGREGKAGASAIYGITDPSGKVSYFRASGKFKDPGTSQLYSNFMQNSKAFVAKYGTSDPEFRTKFGEINDAVSSHTLGGINDPGTGQSLKSVGFKIEELDSGKIAKWVEETGGNATEYFKSEAFLKENPVPEYQAPTAEGAEGGLKGTLGKVATGAGAALSLASGLERMKSRDETTQLGGAMQTAGAVATAVAMTNWWNPVGWVAAIPAALSIGGSFVGGDRSAIRRTPVGKTLRRMNIS